MKMLPSTDQVASFAGPGFSRRRWLQSAYGAGLTTVVLLHPLHLLALDRKVLEAARAMSAMTGVELPQKWLEPAASLVGVILDYSTVLRKLDLGELEPATFFVAR